VSNVGLDTDGPQRASIILTCSVTGRQLWLISSGGDGGYATGRGYGTHANAIDARYGTIILVTDIFLRSYNLTAEGRSA